MTYHSEVSRQPSSTHIFNRSTRAVCCEQHQRGRIQSDRGSGGERAIALQENAGIDIITNGEMRRYAFYGY